MKFRHAEVPTFLLMLCSLAEGFSLHSIERCAVSRIKGCSSFKSSVLEVRRTLRTQLVSVVSVTSDYSNNNHSCVRLHLWHSLANATLLLLLFGGREERTAALNGLASRANANTSVVWYVNI